MKKLTAILLVLVLLFTTSATTLAESPAVGGDSEGGVTTVSLAVDGGQISAMVPITVTLAVKADGNITGPTSYTIKNTSVMPVKVTNVAILAQSGFAITGTSTDTPIGSITMTDGRGGSNVALSSWEPAKESTAWNLGAVGSETANMTLSFGGSVSGIIQDISTAKPAFTVTYTISAGQHQTTP